MNRFALCAICALLAAGCGSQSRGQEECREIMKRYDTVLAGQKASCVKDADCACYGPVSIGSGCGGITDSATVSKLREIEKEFNCAGCRVSVRCAPGYCIPVCISGICVNRRIK